MSTSKTLVCSLWISTARKRESNHFKTSSMVGLSVQTTLGHVLDCRQLDDDDCTDEWRFVQTEICDWCHCRNKFSESAPLSLCAVLISIFSSTCLFFVEFLELHSLWNSVRFELSLFRDSSDASMTGCGASLGRSGPVRSCNR